MENDKNIVDDELETKDGVEDKNSDNQSSDNSKGSKSASATKTFSQEQVSNMMAKEKKQGRAAAYKELGLDPNDSKIVSMFKAFVESQKTDEQKQHEKLVADTTLLAEVENRARVAEAKVDAMQLGVLPQYVDDVVTLVLAKQKEDGDFKTEVSQMKTKYPFWFGEQTQNQSKSEDAKNNSSDNQSVGQKGTGTSVKTGTKNTSEKEKGLGSRLAAQRKSIGSSSSKSYWS